MIDFKRPERPPERTPSDRSVLPAQILTVVSLVAFIPMVIFQLIGVDRLGELWDSMVALWPLVLIWGFPFVVIHFLYTHRDPEE